MAFSMKSKTKINVSTDILTTICQKHFQTSPLQTEEIVAGFYATIYKLVLPNRTVVLKIAPPEHVELLTYEKDIMDREIKAYQLLAKKQIPVPTILVVDDSKEHITSSYYIMEYLDGVTLFSQEQQIKNIKPIKHQLMKHVANMHAITMEYFGYDNLQTYYPTMQETYHVMLQHALDDGTRKKAVYPDSMTTILELLPRFTPLLNDCVIPRFIHFDLWDGNIMIDKDENIIGLIDTERSFNGDPIADFATMLMDPLDPQYKEYYDTYNLHAPSPIKRSKRTLLKYILYKFYLFVLMYVEFYYRSLDGSFSDQQQWCIDEFQNMLQIFQQAKGEFQ